MKLFWMSAGGTATGVLLVLTGVIASLVDYMIVPAEVQEARNYEELWFGWAVNAGIVIALIGAVLVGLTLTIDFVRTSPERMAAARGTAPTQDRSVLQDRTYEPPILHLASIVWQAWTARRGTRWSPVGPPVEGPCRVPGSAVCS